MFGVFCGGRPEDRSPKVRKMMDLLSRPLCNSVPYSFTSVVNHGVSQSMAQSCTEVLEVFKSPSDFPTPGLRN